MIITMAMTVMMIYAFFQTLDNRRIKVDLADKAGQDDNRPGFNRDGGRDGERGEVSLAWFGSLALFRCYFVCL